MMGLLRLNAEGRKPRELTEEQERDIKEAFDLFDADISFSADPRDFGRGIQGLNLGFNQETSEIPAVAWHADNKSSGESRNTSITVHRLSGEPIPICANPDWTIMHVKRALQGCCGFAPVLQKICIGAVLLQDHDKVADIMKTGESLSVAMVVSLDEIDRQLQSSSAHSRAKALTTISHSFNRNNALEAVLASVTLSLSDTSPHVRGAALNTLSNLTKRGDEEVIGKIITCLDDEAAYVRESALFALERLLPDGDNRYQAAVQACLYDSEAQVRCSALHKVEQIMEEQESSRPKGKVAKGWQSLVEGLLSGGSR